MIKRIAGTGTALAIILSTHSALGADATDTARKAASGEASATQSVENGLKRAEEKASLNAFITLDAEGARAAAAAADKAGEHGPLYGVTIAVKDNIASAGVATSAGTPAL